MNNRNVWQHVVVVAWLSWAATGVAPVQAAGPSAQRSPAGSSDEMNSLRDGIRSTLAHYHARPLNTRDHNCWELMHSIVAYGVRSHALRGGPTGEPVNAIGWLCYGKSAGGQTLVGVERGRLAVAKGPRVQGHYGQFLAIVAQAKVRTDYPIEVGRRQFTLADLIESEKLGCQSGTELTFKLIALSHYVDSEATWTSATGEEWSVSRLVAEEIKSPISGAACGGTHRLMGLSYAVRERVKQGRPLDGQFLRADRYTRDYQRYTFRLQNSDGSFSTDWFKGRAAKPDLDRRLQTTGHILEWMAYSVPEETLDDPRLVKAVDYLTGILASNPHREWSIGPLGHGLHALAIYNDRRFTTPAPDDAGQVARRGDSPRPKPKPSAAKRSKAANPSKTPNASKKVPSKEDLPAVTSEGPSELPDCESFPAQPLQSPEKNTPGDHPEGSSDAGKVVPL
ncbi:MAG TPA: hypothetical protein VMV69_15365 [Pirellulales bacterium]|nr:hypothetical protein [Pirellulales bacterium]